MNNLKFYVYYADDMDDYDTEEEMLSAVKDLIEEGAEIDEITVVRGQEVTIQMKIVVA